ncbi:MAG: serine hydrolase, partial [Rhodospirillaceae bacterium]
MYAFANLGKILVATLMILALGSPIAEAKYASMIIDAETGRVYHEVNADTRNYPASLTKMMTLYLLFEKLEQGELNLETKMTVSANASRQPSSKMWLAPGSKISVEDAILGLVVRSAN